MHVRRLQTLAPPASRYQHVQPVRLGFCRLQNQQERHRSQCGCVVWRTKAVSRWRGGPARPPASCWRYHCPMDQCRDQLRMCYLAASCVLQESQPREPTLRYGWLSQPLFENAGINIPYQICITPRRSVTFLEPLQQARSRRGTPSPTSRRTISNSLAFPPPASPARTHGLRPREPTPLPPKTVSALEAVRLTQRSLLRCDPPVLVQHSAPLTMRA